VGGFHIWQMIAFVLCRKSKAPPEKVELVGMQEGKVILNLYNKLI
jgi:hypothetical protein